MKLEWSVSARADRDAIFNYIERDTPRATVAVDKRGRPIAAYRIVGNTLRILRVLQSSRQWPDDMPD